MESIIRSIKFQLNEMSIMAQNDDWANFGILYRSTNTLLLGLREKITLEISDNYTILMPDGTDTGFTTLD